MNRRYGKDEARTAFYLAFTDASGALDGKAIITMISFFIFLLSIAVYFFTAAYTSKAIVLPPEYLNILMVIITSGFVAQAAEFYAQSKVVRTEVIEDARLEAKTANDTSTGVIARQRKQNADLYAGIKETPPTAFYGQMENEVEYHPLDGEEPAPEPPQREEDDFERQAREKFKALHGEESFL